uniref:Uncharacterized protein n=1 Tax=Romanomermis culicivorax TaxID=13658 RepID=A0A915JQJ0_ROMCU
MKNTKKLVIDLLSSKKTLPSAESKLGQSAISIFLTRGNVDGGTDSDCLTNEIRLKNANNNARGFKFHNMFCQFTVHFMAYPRPKICRSSTSCFNMDKFSPVLKLGKNQNQSEIDSIIDQIKKRLKSLLKRELLLCFNLSHVNPRSNFIQIVSRTATGDQLSHESSTEIQSPAARFLVLPSAFFLCTDICAN